ncbi:Uma2 family endonuclease [Mucilaginibacter terrae]|uniref:Uma2 family endonuclease n=1 Tax=Mucilaginibacter terrae TaxID=1955052 RepID=A0ABU3GWX5_9SPHI|nr:Uma2 family endonuclease [Mucilaginibacter terrae]
MHTEEYQLGETFIAPCDVYLNYEQNVIHPDLLFITKEREYIIEKKGIIGAPDLVVEILSTNKIHDQERKLELYERNAVPEYIIIDPETKQVWHYLLQDGKYLPQTDTVDGKLTIRQLHFEITF